MITWTVRIAIGVTFLWIAWKVSIEDLRSSRIRNFWILLGIKISAAAVAVLLVMSILDSLGFSLWGLTQPAPIFKFYLHLLKHFLLVSLAAVVLWKFRIWPAGDAKLFMVFGLMLPLIYPNIRHFPGNLFLVMLLNIFIPACAFFVLALLVSFAVNVTKAGFHSGIRALRKTTLERIKDAWDKFYPRKYELSFLWINFFILFSISQVLRSETQGLFHKVISNELLIFVVLFIVWDRIYEFMMRRSTSVAFVIILGTYITLGALFFPDRILDDMLRGAGMVLRFGMLLMFGKVLVEYYFRKEVSPMLLKELRPGMLLSEESRYSIRRDPDLFNRHFKTSYSDGLTPEQIKVLKEWSISKGGKGQENMTICRTKPFAVWVSIGAVLTLVLQRDVINQTRIYVKLAGAWLASISGGVF